MKYFTKAHWAGAQTDEGASSAPSWGKALRAYREQLEAMRPRLPEEVFAFFEHADIHDGELLHMDIVDGGRAAPGAHPVRVQLEILDAYDKSIWTLEYGTVRRVLADFPSEQPLAHRDGDGFGDLGYHELTDCGGGFFRHEILFASGATLVFEFRDVGAKSRERGDEHARGAA